MNNYSDSDSEDNHSFRVPPAKITELNNWFNLEMEKAVRDVQPRVLSTVKNETSLKIVCNRKLKRGKREGESCGKSVYKYGLCSYHWNVWRKKNPFLKHP